MYFALRLNLYSARTQTYEMAYARVPTVTIDLLIILVATPKLIKLSMNGEPNKQCFHTRVLTPHITDLFDLKKYSIVIKYFSKPS